MKITLFLFTLTLFNISGISQNLISPDELVSPPANSFYGASQAFCFDGSGLSSIPKDVNSALLVTHDSPAVVSPISSANAAFSSGGPFNNLWEFTFNTPKNIKGVALWLPCAAHNGGDAPIKKIVLFNGITMDTIDLGKPNDFVKIALFSSTYIGTSDITIEIIETWYDLDATTPNCGESGWGVYSDFSNLPFSYNVMLGEIMFIEDNTVSLTERMTDNLEVNAYPNPTTGNIGIDLGKIQGKVTTKLVNKLGQVILKEEFESTDFINLDIDEPSGIYFLQLSTDQGEIKTLKIRKQ